MSHAGRYQVYAIRYATRTTHKSEVYLNYHVYGEPDTAVAMDYFFWLVRNDERVILVDCGFAPEPGRRRRRTGLLDPVAALQAFGVTAAAVSQVVVTHAHYDHIGNLARFPAAEVVMARAELDFWTGPMATRAQLAASAEPDELAHLARLRRDGRVSLFSGEHSPAPGISLVEVGGHTPGQLIALVSTGEGTTILASDAVHYYEEIERDRPFSVVVDVVAMYRSFDRIREMAQAPGHRLVAGHDPEVMLRFPAWDGELGSAVARVG